MATKKLAPKARKTATKVTKATKTTKVSKPTKAKTVKVAPLVSKGVLKARQEQAALLATLSKKLDPRFAQQVAAKLNMIASLYEKDIESFSSALESAGALMTSYAQHINVYTREIMDVSTRISGVFKK